MTEEVVSYYALFDTEKSIIDIKNGLFWEENL